MTVKKNTYRVDFAITVVEADDMDEVWEYIDMRMRQHVGAYPRVANITLIKEAK